MEHHRHQDSTNEAPGHVRARAVGGDGQPYYSWPSFLATRSWPVRIEMLFYVGLLAFAFITLGARTSRLLHSHVDLFLASKSDLRPALIFDSHFKYYDVHDAQLQRFLEHLPALLAGCGLYIVISRFVRSRASSPRVSMRAYAVMNLAFTIFIHGWGSIFTIGLLLVNYGAAKYLLGVRHVRYGYFIAGMWICHIALLLCNEHGRGYTDYVAKFLPFFATKPLMRWHHVFNMHTLRLVAWTVDYAEAIGANSNFAVSAASTLDDKRHRVNKKHHNCLDCQAAGVPLVAMAGVNPSPTNVPAVCGCYKARTETPRETFEYDIVSYFAYILYLPLYVAGPITSYNAFVSHVHRPQTAVVGAGLWRYVARTVALYGCLIVFLHVFWVNTIRAHFDELQKFGLLDQMLVMFFTLGFLWLKFNCIWKTFRAVALLDGIEAPEDMKRCFVNTLTIAEFWRDWHASFNLWIVRYMYVPMGGMNNKYIAMPAIFFFIALWHDTRLELLSWAAIMSTTFFLELFATAILSRRSVQAVLRPLPFYRQLRSIGGACTIGSLIIANVIGFGTGMKTTGTIGNVLTAQNAVLAIGTFFMFYVASSVNVTQRMIEANRRAQQQTALDSEIALAAGR